MIIGFIGIIASLLFLIGMAYRGHSVIAIAPLAALVAVAFSGAPMLASYTQIFMPALGGFIVNFFPLFLAGAIFGRLMTVSGYAEDLARWIPTIFGKKQAILVTTLITALLTYGGVSAWVIAFTVVPIAKPLFKSANVSMRLMPAAIALGIFTFATAAIPGSPQIHNAVPTRYFGTTTFAAPVLGIIGTIITFALGLAWLKRRELALAKAGEGFSDIANSANHTSSDEQHSLQKPAAPGTAKGSQEALATASDTAARQAVTNHSEPHFPEVTSLDSGAIARRGLMGLLPVLVVVVVNALFVYAIAPRIDTSYLAEEKFGATNIGAVLGVWSVTVGLFIAGLLIFLLQPSKFRRYVNSLTEGARNAVIPIFTTASEVGYGAVIASLAVFIVLRDALFGISENPVIIGAVAAAVISGVTGSSSGGLSITLETFGAQLMDMAVAQGINPEFLHRAIAMASVSLDSLPHNGAIVTLLVVCGLTHRQSYKDIAFVTVLVPFIGVAAVIALGLLFPVLA